MVSVRGLVSGEDAPDIVANTFLDQISEDQMRDVGYAFLEHRERKLRNILNSAATDVSGSASHH